ncbi:murein biosynthesis integral membrane protein MurJ [Candidatus Parcubacteria bacterium]|nr:murein biosynthesis integral membrane protein MurJ [Candidatus Parcubacteria bacterium]
MITRFLNFQTKTISSAAGILAASALLSKILGLLRDRLLAGNFGAGQEMDIYAAAFRVPDLVYNILIAGGIVVAFLPLFSEYFLKDKEEAWRMVSYILNIFLFLLILFSAVLFILAPWLIEFIVPGFDIQSKELTIALTRLMLLSPIFFGLSSIFSGILHYFNRFLVYSLAPIFYNLGIIFGILFLAPYHNWGIFGVGLGVVLGAFLHLVIQIIPALKCGFQYQWLFDFKYPAIKRIFTLMIPRTIAIAGQQINLIVITAIASTITTGSIAVFYYSNNIQHLPIGIIGISFATAAFPLLSKTWANGQKKEFLQSFSSSFRQILFLIIPAGALMFILRAYAIRIVYGWGKFGWWETQLTAACLGVFCLSIFATALIPLIARAFFAFQDTKTPTLISVISVILNVILSFAFVWLLQFDNLFSGFMKNILRLQGIESIAVVGLALAFSIAAIFQLILLLLFLYKKIGDFEIKKISFSFLKIISATLLMSGGVYSALYLIAPFLNTKTFFGIFFQAGFASIIGILIYITSAIFLKSQEAKALKSLILKRLQA